MHPLHHFNLWALLVATLVRMIVGMLWYSPLLFRKPWLRLSGTTPELEKEVGPKLMPVMILGSFVMALVLAHFIVYAAATTALKGAFIGFLAWLGFIALPLLASAIHEKKPFALFCIHSGFQLAALLAMGALLALWR
jgi:hypothetical protein